MAPTQLTKDDAAKLNLRVVELAALDELDGCTFAALLVRFESAADVPVFVCLDTSGGRFNQAAASTSGNRKDFVLEHMTLRAGMIGSVIHDICTVAGFEQEKYGEVGFGFWRFRAETTLVRVGAAIENKIDKVLHVSTTPITKVRLLSTAAAAFPTKAVSFAIEVNVYARKEDNEDNEVQFMKMFERMKNVVFVVRDPAKFSINPYQLSFGPSTMASAVHQGQSQSQGQDQGQN